VPKARVLRLIDDFAALGAEKIVITGGEPLIHPDWFDLLSFACDRPGIGEVRLQTNAILITPAHVEAFLSFKDRGLIIQTSLEGATPPFHDWVRGKGSFDQTMRGLRLLEQGGLAPQVCIAFTEMRHNFEEIPDLLKLADGMGIGQFVTGTLVPGGRAAQPGSLLAPTPAQCEKLLSHFQSDQAFRDRYHRIGNIATLEWFINTSDAAGTCCTFIETPYITAEGNLYPCVMLHADDAAVSGVFDRSLATAISEKFDVWSRLQKINQSRFTQLDTCKSCPDYAGCGAGCMGRAYAAYGNYFAVEDRCRLRKAVYRWRSNGS
jgi:radical SAM protein with 4Fe4S-binding SPASM domain